MPRTTASVRCCPSTKISIVFRWGLEPRWRAISFMTCQSNYKSGSWTVKVEDKTNHRHPCSSSLNPDCRAYMQGASGEGLLPCLWIRFPVLCQSRQCLFRKISLCVLCLLNNTYEKEGGTQGCPWRSSGLVGPHRHWITKTHGVWFRLHLE